MKSLQWRYNWRDGVSNHQPHDCLLNRLFRHRSKNISKLSATGLCVGNSPVTGEFLAQMASNAEKVSIRWRHHVYSQLYDLHSWKCFLGMSCTNRRPLCLCLNILRVKTYHLEATRLVDKVLISQNISTNLIKNDDNLGYKMFLFKMVYPCLRHMVHRGALGGIIIKRDRTCLYHCNWCPLESFSMFFFLHLSLTVSYDFEVAV